MNGVAPISCENGSNKFSKFAARLGAGIEQLAGKRGFYAGLALAGAGLVAFARRRSKLQAPQRINWQDIPQLPTRTTLEPALPDRLPNNQCAGCNSAVQGKPGPWYVIGQQAYCQDCAPAAARQADVDLALPGSKASPISGVKGANGAYRSPIRSGQRSSNTVLSSITPIQPLPPERRVETKLMPSRLRLRLGEGAEGPVWSVVENGYVVLRRNGLDTGLAVTPALRQDGRGGLQEDNGQWWLTHIDSGKGMSGPYDNPTEAQALASILAQIDWARPEDEINPLDMRRASATATAYQQALAEMKAKVQGEVKEKAEEKEATQPELLGQAQASVQPPALVGRLVADGYGGIARVLDVSDNDTLFMVDSLGQRYEVKQAEIRPPDEQDFEMSRVAMSFDPAKKEETSCAGCGRSSKKSGAGEMWYRMGWKSHCETCAKKYAAEEAYIMEDEVGDLELV